MVVCISWLLLLLSYIIVSYIQLSLLEPCSGQWPNFEEAELCPILICTSPRGLLNLVPGSSDNLQVPFAGIEVAQKNKLFIVGDTADDGCEVLVEIIVCVRCGGHCRGIHADKGDCAYSGVES